MKSMKKMRTYAVLLSLAATSAWVTAAQEASSGSASVPKILQITREFIKPGKAGLVHDKSEGAFVEAMSRAQWPTHYIAMTSLSGKTRALYLTSYESFDAWQKDTAAIAKNAALSAALEHAAVADGDLLDSIDQGVFYFREEMSLRPRADLSQMRFMELTLFHVRPGKQAQWNEVVKMAKSGYEKALPDSHWGMFEQMYGADSGTYLLLTSHKSLAEIDKGLTEDKQFTAAMGEEGMRKFDALYAECCETAQQQLFAFSPAQSYVQEDWIKTNPDFWKPRPAATAKATAIPKKSNP
jgi:hypothetical protein